MNHRGAASPRRAASDTREAGCDAAAKAGASVHVGTPSKLPGATVSGQFAEHGDPGRFTWLRGFHDLQARSVVNAAFYCGPPSRQHRAEVNAILPVSDNDSDMPMRPLHPGRGIAVLPAADRVVRPGGAGGIVAAGVRGRPTSTPLPRVPNMRSPTTGRTCMAPACGCGWAYAATKRCCAYCRRGWQPSNANWTWAAHGPVGRIVMDPTSRSRLRWLPFNATDARDAFTA